MTHDEIEAHKHKLAECLQRMRDPNVKADDSKLLQDLHELALQVGACPVISVRQASGLWSWDRARAPEYAYNIHLALQTASMIDACRTAAKNHEIALQSPTGCKNIALDCRGGFVCHRAYGGGGVVVSLKAWVS